MKFEIDSQTRKDLDIINDNADSRSVYSIFNNLNTSGGKNKLYELLTTPTSDIRLLNHRKEIILYLHKNKLQFDLNYHQFDFIEHYFRLNRTPLHDHFIDSFIDNLSDKLKPTNDYYLILTGIHQMLLLNEQAESFLQDIKGHNVLPPYISELRQNFEEFSGLIRNNTGLTKKGKLTTRSVNRLDYLFRKKAKGFIREFLDHLYTLECYISIGKTIDKYGFNFAEYKPSGEPNIMLKGLFHPLLENPVSNDFDLNSANNLCFLTGPNMAGKSTFLKSIGITVYLAHTGFPVPAAYMETTVFNGLITTINLSDDINKGYSHYYSEVRRVKDTALKILERNNILVIFDELFRGTNVKDAYDATLEVINSLSKIKDCLFLISTHITEIADKFEDDKSIRYNYFDSQLQKDEPVYDYKLKKGVSSERLGMKIIQKEKIIEILKLVIERQESEQ